MAASLGIALRLSVGAKSDSHFADLKGLISRGAVVVVTGAGFSRLISGDPAYGGPRDSAQRQCRRLPQYRHYQRNLQQGHEPCDHQ